MHDRKANGDLTGIRAQEMMGDFTVKEDDSVYVLIVWGPDDLYAPYVAVFKTQAKASEYLGTLGLPNNWVIEKHRVDTPGALEVYE